MPSGVEPTALRLNGIRVLTLRRVSAGLAGLLCAAITVALLSCMTRGPAERIGVWPSRPGYHAGSGIYAHPPYLGFVHWQLAAEIAVFAQALVIYGWYALMSWRERRFRPVLIMLVVATLIAPLWDPLISWAAYTAYDPRLLHVPETWPLYDIVPTVQPVSTLPGYAMFFVMSVGPGLLLHRFLVRHVRPGAVTARRRLLSLVLIVGAWAAIFDAIQAYIATRFEIITYSQISLIAFRPGATWQSNALWEPMLCFVMFGVAALCVYEDSEGRTIAHRWRRLQTRPLLREFAVSFVVVTMATALYTACFALVRLSGTATSVACPWPYQDTAVYDPDGLYARKCPTDRASRTGQFNK